MNILSQTPFQRIENRNIIERSLLKQKINHLQNKKFDFNINTKLIKNVKLENIDNIEKEIFKSIKNSEKFDNIGNIENDEHLYKSMERTKSISLKRYYSSKEKLFPSPTQPRNEFEQAVTKVKKLNNNIILIEDFKGKIDKNKIISAFDKKGNSDINFFSQDKIIESNKFKNQCSNNTEIYFYHKNMNFSPELKNYFHYKKRPQTNYVKASPFFLSKTKRIISSKNSEILDKKQNNNNNRPFSYSQQGFKDNNQEVIINRKHASVQYKDLSKNIQVIKVDRLTLNKIKNFEP